MKSPLLINFIVSTILAIVAFVAFPASALESNIALAIGILVGGIVIPPAAGLLQPGQKSESLGLGSEPTTLYVGNLPYKASENEVKEHFEQQGKVRSVRLMKDRRTGKRKGYGFVEIDSRDADKVITKLNDSEFQERTLKVRLAKEKSHE